MPRVCNVDFIPRALCESFMEEVRYADYMQLCNVVPTPRACPLQPVAVMSHKH
jgi:hypothetical protein